MSDPVVAITERDATGVTAAIYADIRAVLGVGVVNLIWRHLATMPGALPWAWETVRPLYVSGALITGAVGFRADLESARSSAIASCGVRGSRSVGATTRDDRRCACRL